MRSTKNRTLLDLKVQMLQAKSKYALDVLEYKRKLLEKRRAIERSKSQKQY